MRGYGRRFGSRRIIEPLDLTLAAGERVALLGASGSGKSTLLRALAGLDPEADGRVTVPARRTMVFQDARLLPWRRAWRNVLVGLHPRVRARAISALDEVGMAHLADAWPATLSGGEAQRVALARAFVRAPELLLLDEPFSALDALTRIRMHELLLALHRRHRPCMMIVTHDVDEAMALAERILVLSRGRLVLDEALGPETFRPGLRQTLFTALGVAPHPATQAHAEWPMLEIAS